MKTDEIHTAHGLVEVTFNSDLDAVYLRWISEYDEGTRVRDAVRAALDYVRANDVKHWVVDVSMSSHALSNEDYEWVSSEDFRASIRNSPLQKFVLLPPLPDSGQDDRWVKDWEQNTLANFGDRVKAKVCDGLKDARTFLLQEKE
ncbi:hypothetical protein DFP92_12010 [Yoonia sediminilitoris]|uniref:Uncharacterized protein n=2 Tax=Yoonia sediminilitoris TaxID=1286148 RepID=A0A2T6K6J3_9RHOB|nr:hypothetical protein C8N45_12010 [Yoonia sediminilitoris]RCW89756.1 hypothetical protein DFP92_12010 [Yoonia sediminilitoris]